MDLIVSYLVYNTVQNSLVTSLFADLLQTQSRNTVLLIARTFYFICSIFCVVSYQKINILTLYVYI